MSDDERPSKRKRNMPDLQVTSPTEEMEADSEIELAADGDAVIIVKGIAGVPQPIGIRVSSYVLSTNSTGFEALLAQAQVDNTADPPTKSLRLPDDDGNTIYILCCVLHLRNDKLPARLQPDAFLRYVTTAARYDCIIAAGRCASQWFDYIYHKLPETSAYKMIEAAYLLDDPIWFARYTNRWVLEQPLGQRLEDLSPGSGGQRLALELLARQKESINSLKADMDMIIDPLAEALSSEVKHYIDCDPGDEPQGNDGVEEDDRETETCTVDKENSTLFLSSLRNANIWPATRWPNVPGEVVKKVEKFIIPPYDIEEQCHTCMCVEQRFSNVLALVQAVHQDRLWGVCLDCFKAGGLKDGECRYEHVKVGHLSASQKARQMALAATPLTATFMRRTPLGASFPTNSGNAFLHPPKSAHPAIGQANGMVSAQLNGGMNGQAGGRVNGQTNGGPANGQTNGQASGKATGGG